MLSIREGSASYTVKDLKSSATAARILLVEDNEMIRENLEEFLFFCGYKVLAIANGSSLFQALADFKPHLISLDLKLPNIDGYTLLEQLQESSDWRQIPVIVVSASALKADRQRAQRLGAIDYLVKPVSLDHLQQAIGIAIQRFSLG